MTILDNIIKPGDLVFDVGCNLGGKTEEYFRRGAKVIGFEPQPACIQHLLNKFSNNKNVTIEPIGLDSYRGIAFIYESDAHTISSMSLDFINTVKKERFAGYRWKDKIQISVNTLDHMIEKHGTPSYIKIDVEGYELNVLKGLTQKIDVISIEFTPELCDNTIKCMDYLETICSDSTYNYGFKEEPEFKFDWLSKDDMVGYLRSVTDFKYEFGDVYIRTTPI